MKNLNSSVLKFNSSAYVKSKTNGLLTSEVLFDTINSPQFSEILEKTKRSVNSIGTPDPLLTKVLEEQGFNALPTLVDDKHYAYLVKSGLAEIYRGVRKDDAIVDFATNENMFVGKGLYCNGIYFMYGDPCPSGRHGDTSAKARATRYIQPPKDIPNEKVQEHLKTFNQGQVISALVSKDARIINFKDLLQLKTKFNNDVRKSKMDISPEVKAKLTELISRDISVLAAIEGFDIIDISLTKYMVVLNRGKLIMNKSDVEKNR